MSENAPSWVIVIVFVFAAITMSRCADTVQRKNCLSSGRGYIGDTCLHDIRRDAEVK